VIADPSDPSVDSLRRPSGVKGVELVTGRTVFDNGANGIELACPRCAAVRLVDEIAALVGGRVRVVRRHL
jgi:hypothetical protein